MLAFFSIYNSMIVTLGVSKTPPSPTQTGPSIDHCKRKLQRSKCTNVIENSVFKKEKISNKCCVAVWNLGKPCYEKILKASPKYKEDESKSKSKGEEIWKKCYDYVAKCKKKAKEEECEREFYFGITNKGGSIIDRCCSTLRKIGRDCYKRILLLHFYAHDKKEAKEFWQKSEKIWKQCKKKPSAAPPPS